MQASCSWKTDRSQPAKLQVGKLHTGLLGSEGGNQVHQHRGQSIVALQSNRLELGAHIIHSTGVESLLDDR